MTRESPESGYPSQPNLNLPDRNVGFVWVPPARPKFKHPYGRHLTLFVLTFLTTTFAGSAAGFGAEAPLDLLSWEAFTYGLWYSLPLLVILSAHEFGHYFACRRHNVDATLPYFIPAPPPLITGTFGAVIRIREPFPSRRALFDIGVAGPIAGFVALLPFLYFGVRLSRVEPLPEGVAVWIFGEPLVWKLFEYLTFGPIPAGMDTVIHPMGFAAWWGLLATALNLLPFGQLDGGHIMHANVGRHAAVVSGLTLAIVVGLTFLSASWVLMAVMLVVMAVMFGFRHPRVISEDEGLDPRRRLISIAALVIFILSFTPAPIYIEGM